MSDLLRTIDERIAEASRFAESSTTIPELQDRAAMVGPLYEALRITVVALETCGEHCGSCEPCVNRSLAAIEARLGKLA